MLSPPQKGYLRVVTSMRMNSLVGTGAEFVLKGQAVATMQ